ncbi:MAG: adenosylcobinamide-GDP ribazoletransferase [Deltaproteobacteria bacterium]|jgi:adenosylcobinamide-GDP ribazoletransferase|nr:adenosylcobinamide-GDP ribazoletransferase [Deltaproteobacteria bacterium]
MLPPVAPFLRRPLLALGFLTRLAPAMSATPEEMSASCRFYPLAGAILGLVLVLGLLPLMALTGNSSLGGWVYVLLSAWLTRALHLDGLADLADALGSGKSGADFWLVLKDSRLGVFGCLALILALGGQACLVQACLDHGRLAPLLFAPVFARCLPRFLADLAPARASSGLGAILAAATGGRLAALAWIVLPGLLCLGPARLLAALAAAFFLLVFLGRLARREGGYNGDFFGALIVCAECAALVAAVPV